MSEVKVGKYVFYAECTKDGASKFWAIQKTSVAGQVLTSWGKIGTKGQSQLFDEATADKRKREKIAKGYNYKEFKMAELNREVKDNMIHDAEKHLKKVKEEAASINFLEELGKI